MATTGLIMFITFFECFVLVFFFFNALIFFSCFVGFHLDNGISSLTCTRRFVQAAASLLQRLLSRHVSGVAAVES